MYRAGRAPRPFATLFTDSNGVIVIWLLALACSGDDTGSTSVPSTTLEALQSFGGLEVCLSSSAGQQPTSEDSGTGLTTWVVDGTLADKDSPAWGDFVFVPCSGAAQRVFEIVDDDGDSWFVGWTITEPDGGTIGLDPDLPDGGEVSLRVAQDGADGPAAFTLQDSTGLLFLMDAQAVSSRMDGSDYPGLGISWGLDYGGVVSGDCAWQASQLVLQGEGTSELYAGDEDGLNIDGQPFKARAFAIYRDPASDACERSHAFLLHR